MILAGDIGGTKTRLGIFSADRGPDDPVVRQTYPSQEFAGLEDIVRAFLKKHGLSAERASFGVAGPIKQNRAQITNLPWIIDGDRLQRETGIGRVALLNDLEAMAHAVPHLDESMLVTINQGVPVPECTKALVAPGTGLGEVFLTWDGHGRYRPNSSEGGHTEFGPRTELQMELLAYLLEKYDHVSYERVCAGVGIPNLYAFLRDTGKHPEPEALARDLAEAEDQTPVIVRAGLERPEENPICVAVLELFTEILGAEAGNLALKVSCYGGMYIGGGIPPRMPEYIRSPRFLEAFRAKGRLSPMVADMPIHLVTHRDTALMGAACHALGL
ncbi:glucokinase [Salidesulfovibrio onnuriiensis]|uniref:glucokinase n=1 Tax=Salidesulfovibrio onnuriiensis TaxID=2583823 RepID=UPI0011CC0FCC|nr:glucokinase [Salidesulfovibrio onnuriiensis]